MILTCAHDDGHSEVIMVFGSYLVPCMCFLDICLQSFPKQTTHCLKINMVEKVASGFSSTEVIFFLMLGLLLWQYERVEDC